MKPSVYIETSVVSYLTARPSRNATVAVFQNLTRRWWTTAPNRFRLFASEFVAREAEAGDPTAARARREALHGIPLLEATAEVGSLTAKLLELRAVPPAAANDAAHIAIAAVNQVDYLVTWNFRHIANATMRASIEEACRRAAHRPPVICSPNQLMEP